jgi:hypothetical protein
MMIAEAKLSSLYIRFLDVLKGIQAQGDEKVKLMRQLVKDQKPSREN